jgi:putative phage-type endonuclease
MNEVPRSSGIGASEAAAACGLSPYQQTAELYLRKVGEAPDIETTEAMLFGTCIEAGGIRFFSELNNIPVKYPMPTVRHPEHAFMLATPDAEITSDEGLEFKSMGWQLARQVEQYGLADICPQYVLQAQQQMACMGWQVVRLVALVERTLKEWPIERNERLINTMIEREGVFWDHVQRRICPDIDFTKAGALRAVEALYPEIKTGAVVRFDEDANAAAEAYEKLGKQASEIKDQRDQYKAFCLNTIGENYGGLMSDGRMMRRKEITRKGYVVEPSTYIDVRIAKYDGSKVLENYTEIPLLTGDLSLNLDVEESDVVSAIDERLRGAGFILNHASPSGSRYYVHGREHLRFRVSDHEPNLKTADWMARVDCRDIRTGDVLLDVRSDGFGAINAFLMLDSSLS